MDRNSRRGWIAMTAAARDSGCSSRQDDRRSVAHSPNVAAVPGVDLAPGPSRSVQWLGPITLHSEEHLATSNRGIGMLRRLMTQQIKAVQPLTTDPFQ